MKRIALLLIATFAMGVAALLAMGGRVYGATWKPTLHATIDRSTIVHGETAHISYNSPDATGAAYNITQYGEIIGWADGVSIPVSATSRTLQITPALPGTFVLTIVVAKRRLNLNQDLATVEGHRRTTPISFPITVLAIGEKPGNAWDGQSPFQAAIRFDPPTIKLGESVQRSWASNGPRGTKAYIDGQLVPANGSDVLRPAQSLESVLNVTAGRRWQWHNAQRATVTVEK